jgi:hypothetical protein
MCDIVTDSVSHTHLSFFLFFNDNFTHPSLTVQYTGSRNFGRSWKLAFHDSDAFQHFRRANLLGVSLFLIGLVGVGAQGSCAHVRRARDGQIPWSEPEASAAAPGNLLLWIAAPHVDHVPGTFL